MSYGVAVAVALSVSAFVFAYLSVNFKDKHSPLKWLLMIMSVATTGFQMIVMSSVSRNAGYGNIADMVSWIGYGFIIVLIFVVMYFLIYFIVNSLGKASDSKVYGEGSG